MKNYAAFFRLALFLSLVFPACPASEAYGIQPPEEALADEEMRELHHAANSMVDENEHEEAFAIFLQIENRAREVDDPYWLMIALWKQAQHHSRLGDIDKAIELYTAAGEAMHQAEERKGRVDWANRWLLYANLVTDYRSRGQMGEAYRIHRMAEDDTIAYFREVHKTDITADPFNLVLEGEGRITFVDRFLMDEASFRFLAGETESALALTQRIIDRHEAASDLTHWNLSGLSRAYAHQIYRLHRVGRHDEAMAFSEQLLAMEENSSTSYELNRERVRSAYYRMKSGEPPTGLVTQAEVALQTLRENRHMPARLEASQYMARIYFFRGDSGRAFTLLDEVIEESRGKGYGAVLAEALLVRAELLLETGRGARAERDLLEAIALLRRQGQWRLEVGGYALYARYLLAEGRLDRAREIASRGIYLAQQFHEPVWLKVLVKIRAEIFDLLAAADDEGAGKVSWADLQPLRMVTTVAEGEFARGRFVLTNPGRDEVEGEISVTGPASGLSWNSGRRLLAVEIDPQLAQRTLGQNVTIPPGGEVTVYLQTAPAPGTSVGQATVEWRGQEQASFWEYEAGGSGGAVSIVTSNVAMQNPFYPVSLYQEIYYRGEEEKDQSIRVRTSKPSRVEIVDHRTGGMLAVDATGDGEFSGIGDVVFRDAARDGFPDLSLSSAEDVAALLLFVFPEGPDNGEDLAVEVDVLENGEWRQSGTNRFVPVREGRH